MSRLDGTAQIPAALAEMRTTRGLTRQTLAEQADMKPTQYGTYENGHKVPNAENLLRLADAANFDVILVPREQARALVDLAHSVPFNALAAIAAMANLDVRDAS